MCNKKAPFRGLVFRMECHLQTAVAAVVAFVAVAVASVAVVVFAAAVVVLNHLAD